MNIPMQNPNRNWVLRTPDDSSNKKRKSSASRKRLAAFTSGWWRMGFAFLLLGTPLVRADILPNNFWVNPTFELGSNLDQTDGTVSNWNRGGNDGTIC
jgi:hypothetical protein